MIQPSFLSWNCSGSQVLLRCDLNLPQISATTYNDFRLRALLPTIDALLEKKAHIVLATHWGRPTGKDTQLSTRNLLPLFKQHGYDVAYIEKISDARASKAPISIIENLRFFAGEKNGDRTFAQEIASCGDFYINDAWGAAHRADTSLIFTPHFFPETQRSIGLLVAREYDTLNHVRTAPKKPLIIILGGGKPTEKAARATELIPHIDALLCGPALDTLFHEHTNTEKIHLPKDFLVGSALNDTHPTQKSADAIVPGEIRISIGEKTEQAWEQHIARAGTIVFNGIMGDISVPATTAPTRKLLEAMAASQAFTIVAGGASNAAVDIWKIGDTISFRSTGGGSTLGFLAGEPLLALEIFGL